MDRINTEIADFFDNLAPKWDRIMKIPSDAEILEFLKMLEIPESGKVLDVGTGTGLMLKGILSFRPSMIFACDISAEMLRIAKMKLNDLYRGADPSAAGGQRPEKPLTVSDGDGGTTVINFIHADVKSLPIEGSSIDTAVCNGVYPHFEEKLAALSELYRVMKPGALLGINHFSGREAINRIHSNSENQSIRTHLLKEPEEELAILKESGFDIVELKDTPDIFRIIAKKAGRTEQR